jgi:hypothetical protein
MILREYRKNNARMIYVRVQVGMRHEARQKQDVVFLDN